MSNLDDIAAQVSEQRGQLYANIEARKTFNGVLELIGEQPQRFWELLAEHCAAKLPAKPKPESIEAMSDDEAKRFSLNLFSRGKYENFRVREVPPSYCLWWAEEDRFSIAMRRYVKSGYFQRLQAEPEDDFEDRDFEDKE